MPLNCRHFSSPARSSLRLWALLVLVAELSLRLHGLLVSHTVCAVHGELVHGETAHGAEAPRSHPARSTLREATAEHDDEHCAAAVRLSERAELASVSVHGELEQTSGSELGERAGFAVDRRGRLLSAPKQSPPRA